MGTAVLAGAVAGLLAAGGCARTADGPYEAGLGNEFAWDDDTFGVWDADDDGFLNDRELTTGFYDTFDANDDGWLLEDEWGETGLGYDFDTLDADDDDRLGRTEVADGVRTRWDRNDDGLLDDDEFGI